MVQLANGAYLYISAFCCKDVLREENGSLSAIRILDSVTVELMGPLEKVIYYPLPVTTLISFKSDIPCDFTLRIRVVDSHGASREMAAGKHHSEGGIDGGVVNLQMELRTDVEGLYWFELLADDQIVTKFPVKVSHAIQPQTGTRPTAESTDFSSEPKTQPSA